MPDLTNDLTEDLFADIDKSGYFPAVVKASVTAALAGERVISFLVHHEPTIDHDQVRRHMTVAVVTPSRLLLAHTDDHPGDDMLPQPYAATTTEAISMRRVRSVVVNRMVAQPDKYVGEVDVPTSEAVVTLGWGGVNRIDIEPAVCADPDCTADHGYTGGFVSDDFSLRVSAAADGEAAVTRLLHFADCISALTAGEL
jgi:hypothetical protein